MVTGGEAEWLVPMGSTDPTYLVLGTSASMSKSHLTYPNAAGDCFRPITQPACNSGDPNYCGSACKYCFDNNNNLNSQGNPVGAGPDICRRFIAPGVRGRQTGSPSGMPSFTSTYDPWLRFHSLAPTQIRMTVTQRFVHHAVPNQRVVQVKERGFVDVACVRPDDSQHVCMTGVDTQCLIASSMPTGRSKS